MRRIVASLVAVLLTGCAAFGSTSGGMLRVSPNSAKPKSPRTVMLSRSVVSPPMAADTLVMAVGWVNPVDDGKGPLDSLRVHIVGWTPTPTMVWRGPGWSFPTSHTFRVPIDYTQQSGGSATFTVRACVGVWRFRQYAETCSANVSVPVVYPAPPPPGPVNLNVTRVP